MSCTGARFNKRDRNNLYRPDRSQKVISKTDIVQSISKIVCKKLYCAITQIHLEPFYDHLET